MTLSFSQFKQTQQTQRLRFSEFLADIVRFIN